VRSHLTCFYTDLLRYSFCRVADDLVDNSSTEIEARQWIKKLTNYLDLAYVSDESKAISKQQSVQSYVKENFPEASRAALLLLPTHLLSYGPLYDLLEGFKTDLEFQHAGFSRKLRAFPIKDDQDLEVYAARVAGTVAELCLELVFHHTTSITTSTQREHLVRAGGRMGIALQYVNIARDIATDAAIDRVYIPTDWLKAESLTPENILESPEGLAIDRVRAKILDKAFAVYREARSAMAELPVEARAPMRVAVESYMEIGRVLRKEGYILKRGRATVPKLRRLKVAWKALNNQ
jgi:15-cis-phytoene synthase/lycopene beta-cyclase